MTSWHTNLNLCLHIGPSPLSPTLLLHPCFLVPGINLLTKSWPFNWEKREEILLILKELFCSLDLKNTGCVLILSVSWLQIFLFLFCRCLLFKNWTKLWEFFGLKYQSPLTKCEYPILEVESQALGEFLLERFSFPLQFSCLTLSNLFQANEMQ